MKKEGKGQARITINDNAFVVLDNAVFLVLDNSATNALSTSGTGGNIVSEAETNSIKWNIQNNTGIYTVPFTTTPTVQGGTETKIPVEVNISTAGTADGSILFSTYETTTDMNLPWASGVTSMNDNSGDQSLMVVDRFWIIDANGYTTDPTATIELTYDDAANEIGGSNALTETALQAQRWNPSGGWGGLLYGTVNATTNKVSGINVTSSNFYKTWILTDQSTPLPITLLYFDVTCKGENHEFRWATAAEINNAHFIIQQSEDALNWFDLIKVVGLGNSTQRNSYSWTKKTAPTGNYFRLKQVDFNGEVNLFNTEYKSCQQAIESNTLSIFPNPNKGEFTISLKGVADIGTISLFDARGKLIYQTQLNNPTESISPKLPLGVYSIMVKTPSAIYQEKVIIN